MKLKLKAGSEALFAYHVTMMITIMIFAYIDETVSLYLSVFWIFLMVAEGILGLYQERLSIFHTETCEDYCEYCGQKKNDNATKETE